MWLQYTHFDFKYFNENILNEKFTMISLETVAASVQWYLCDKNNLHIFIFTQILKNI